MATVNARESYLAQYEAHAARRAGEPEWLLRLRQAAIERFAAVGFPSRHEEAWKYTDIAQIVETPFLPVRNGKTLPAIGSLAEWALPGALLAVLVDGRFADALSGLDQAPGGVTVCSLADAVRRFPALVEPHLGRLAGAGGHAFTLLNTALFGDGAFVHVPRGVTVDRPIHVLLLAGAFRQSVAYPRVLVVAEEASEVTIVETYLSLGPGEHFSCATTEIAVGEGARVDHYKIGRESAAARHVAAQAIGQLRDSSFSSHSFTLGGGLVRNDVAARLDGEGAGLVLNGLYYLGGSQHADTQMRVEHIKPRCESHELYKGVLDGKASAVFNGLIHVHPGAQKTNAKQSNRNLLLSRDALANSNPQLRIFADDVKCTHGSTVGQLDEDAVFYLRSRGIGHAKARGLLTWAFAREVVEGVKPLALRAQLEGWLAARLPVLGEAGATA